jgi:hypothetical protein
MHDSDEMAPMVPPTTDPTILTTRADGGPTQRDGFERPPEATGAAADRHREVITPGVADLR